MNEPVKIIDQLYLSDISVARETSKDKFDVIVTVCQDSIEDNVGCRYRQFNMSDGDRRTKSYGGSSDYSVFEDACDFVLSQLRNNNTILIHCHMGQSRSVAVTIACVAVYNNITFHEAKSLVREKRQTIRPHKTLLDHAKKYISDAEKGTVAVPFDC